METGSVTAAAHRLQCTQPAVSAALTKFEKASGLGLFDRTTGRLTPTAEGEALYVEVERGMLGLDRIASTARELREGHVGRVRIAAEGAPSIMFLPSVIAEFVRTYPGVTVELHTQVSKDVVTWVSNRETDIGLVELPLHFPGVTYEEFTQSCVCLMPVDHPLADRQVVTPDDLVDEQLVGVQEHHAVNIQLREAFAAAGHEFTTLVNGYYFATCRGLVREGAGLAIVDAFNGIDIGDGVVARRFEPAIQYELAIAYEALPELAPEVEAFLGILRTALVPYLAEEP
jgi:DNA-binding transcriptional LysR family regulator